MKLYDNLVQGSDEWHQVRAEHFTASECPAMMGASKYKSRPQLMKDKKGFKEVISAQLQKRFDQGHETEEKARELLEFETADSFEAAVASIEIDGLKLLASLDGLSEDEKTIFEHKLWNATLVENVRNNVLEPTYYWQLEQQLLVFGADQVLFMVSDGTSNKREIMYYKSAPERREKLIAGWKQFKIDLEGFELKAKQEVVVATCAKNNLPAITYHVTGTEISTNIGVCLEQIKEMAQEEMSKTLETDQDFADKDQLNKDVKKARAALKESISKVRGEFVSYSQFEEIAQDMDVVLQKMQSHGEKQVKQAKDVKKQSIKSDGEKSVSEYVKECDLKIKPMSLSAITGFFMPDFDLAMKNKRTIESLENAVSESVANLKIEINQAMDRIVPNLQYLRDNAVGYKFLFSDSQQLVNQDAEPFQAIIKSRIADHKKGEEDRLEEERKRIQAEEEEKAQREAQAKLDEEREKIRKEEQVKAQAEQQAKTDKEAEELAERDKHQAAMNKKVEIGRSFKAAVGNQSSMAETMAQGAPTLSGMDMASGPDKTATMEMVTITQYEYQQLLDDSLFLGLLKNAGVDNWSGYSDAQEEMEDRIMEDNV